ncbi:hypothetical protein PIB30_101625, partial [Stylosanthes scabra]|nr:hypothetical protein [Stylosanthes scabra]
MAKQIAVALIYGDLEDSYTKIPCCVLGVQLSMPGSLAILKSCFVRVGGEVDDSLEYFQPLFWTFPPCVEALMAQICLPGILVLSNRHNDIKAALEDFDYEWLPPSAYQAEDRAI